MQLYYSSKLCYTECIKKEGEHMKQLTITIDDFLYDFYRKIGNNAGKTPEKTIEDALLYGGNQQKRQNNTMRRLPPV